MNHTNKPDSQGDCGRVLERIGKMEQDALVLDSSVLTQLLNDRQVSAKEDAFLSSLPERVSARVARALDSRTAGVDLPKKQASSGRGSKERVRALLRCGDRYVDIEVTPSEVGAMSTRYDILVEGAVTCGGSGYDGVSNKTISQREAEVEQLIKKVSQRAGMSASGRRKSDRYGSERVIDSILLEVIVHATRSLGPICQKALVLRWLSGLEFSEIGLRLSMPTKVAKNVTVAALDCVWALLKTLSVRKNCDHNRDPFDVWGIGCSTSERSVVSDVMSGHLIHQRRVDAI
jgi:hypothetical protein